MGVAYGECDAFVRETAQVFAGMVHELANDRVICALVDNALFNIADSTEQAVLIETDLFGAVAYPL